jgi:hypothetical protein
MIPAMPFAKTATPTLVIGRPQSLWYLTGSPGAGLTPAITAGGVNLTQATMGAVNGALPHADPGSGNAYLARLSAGASQPGMLMLCDRLQQIGGNSGGVAIPVTLTTASTINSAALPARDVNGATSGVGIQAALEIITATGVGNATPAIGYTNSAGTAGKTASLIDTYVASSAIGAFYRFQLAAGDVGVQSIQTLTLTTSMTSGSIALVLYRVLATMEIMTAGIPNAIDALTAGFPRLFNGTTPFFVFIPTATTAATVTGSYAETQG